MSWSFQVNGASKSEALLLLAEALRNHPSIPRDNHILEAAGALLASAEDGHMCNINTHGHTNSSGSGGIMLSVSF